MGWVEGIGLALLHGLLIATNSLVWRFAAKSAAHMCATTSPTFHNIHNDTDGAQ